MPFCFSWVSIGYGSYTCTYGYWEHYACCHILSMFFLSSLLSLMLAVITLLYAHSTGLHERANFWNLWALWNSLEGIFNFVCVVFLMLIGYRCIYYFHAQVVEDRTSLRYLHKLMTSMHKIVPPETDMRASATAAVAMGESPQASVCSVTGVSYYKYPQASVCHGSVTISTLRCQSVMWQMSFQLLAESVTVSMFTPLVTYLVCICTCIYTCIIKPSVLKPV